MNFKKEIKSIYWYSLMKNRNFCTLHDDLCSICTQYICGDLIKYLSMFYKA